MVAVPVAQAQAALMVPVAQALREDPAAVPAPPILRRDLAAVDRLVLAVAARSGREAAVISRVAEDPAAALAEADPVAAATDLSPR